MGKRSAKSRARWEIACVGWAGRPLPHIRLPRAQARGPAGHGDGRHCEGCGTAQSETLQGAALAPSLLRAPGLCPREALLLCVAGSTEDDAQAKDTESSEAGARGVFCGQACGQGGTGRTQVGAPPQGQDAVVGAGVHNHCGTYTLVSAVSKQRRCGGCNIAVHGLFAICALGEQAQSCRRRTFRRRTALCRRCD